MKTQQVTGTLIVCEVCGAMFANQEDADGAGCNKPIQEPSFRVGQRVLACMTVAAGIEDLGPEWGEAEIKAVVCLQPRFQKEFSFQNLRDGWIGFMATAPRKHKYSYRVHALSVPRKIRGGFWTMYPLPESKIQPLTTSSAD